MSPKISRFQRAQTAATGSGSPPARSRRRIDDGTACSSCQLVLQVVADLVQDRAHRPRVDQPVVGQLHERERVELAAEPAQRDAAAERRGREAGPHVGERRRRRDAARVAEVHEHVLVAVERDPVAGDQPLAERALPLAEQLEVEVPDPLGGADPVVGLALQLSSRSESAGPRGPRGRVRPRRSSARRRCRQRPAQRAPAAR